MKLFKVTLRGMYDSYGISYAVADNAGEAYEKVKSYLDEKKIGFASERELDKVELLADSYKYTPIKTILYL